MKPSDYAKWYAKMQHNNVRTKKVLQWREDFNFSQMNSHESKTSEDVELELVLSITRLWLSTLQIARIKNDKNAGTDSLFRDGDEKLTWPNENMPFDWNIYVCVLPNPWKGRHFSQCKLQWDQHLPGFGRTSPSRRILNEVTVKVIAGDNNKRFSA